MSKKPFPEEKYAKLLKQMNALQIELKPAKADVKLGNVRKVTGDCGGDPDHRTRP